LNAYCPKYLRNETQEALAVRKLARRNQVSQNNNNCSTSGIAFGGQVGEPLVVRNLKTDPAHPFEKTRAKISGGIMRQAKAMADQGKG
jgi:hypothetical protein